MNPQQFKDKWGLTQKDLAAICDCSLDTVKKWFSKTDRHQPPEPYHLHRLKTIDDAWCHRRRTDEDQSAYCWDIYKKAAPSD